MGPSRKKSRKNPAKEEDPPQTSTQREAEGSSASTTIDIPAQPDNNSTPKPQADALTSLKEQQNGNKSDASSTKELRSTKSWYGGTWPRLQKSTASTKVARESILAGKPKNAPVTADLSRFDPPRKLSTTSSRPPSMYLGKSKETSSTSDITMGGTFESSKAAELESKSESKLNINHIPKEDTEEVPTQAPNLEAPSKTDTSTVERPERPATASGWLGWLGRPDGYKPVNKIEDAQALKPPEPVPAAEEPSAQPQPIPTDSSSTTALQKQAAASAPTTSWFGFWSSAEPTPTPSEAPKEQIPVKITQDVPDVTMTDVPQDKPTVQPVAGSSWAFWSSAETTKKDSRASAEEQQTGELAVAGEASQNKPEPAQTKSVKEDKKTKANKRGRPQSVEIDEATRKAAQLNPASTKTNTTPSPAPSKTLPPNILIPSVKSTYRMMDNPSVLEQVARLLHLSEQRPVKHVFLSKDPPKIKKALAIGIHGLFPAPLLRTVIGQPTGTSIRFANHAAAALRRWADQHGSATCEIEKVALEGEGKIAERVDNLWKLLLNWIDHVRSADFIMVACHSQGVPVALMLVAKLIEFGVVTSARIGVCAMAGVSLGPFADYKSRLFSGSAGELFEFADPDSVVSKRYEDALRAALNYGVRVTYCGSIDDQLISMESSVFSTVSHPHIYRTVFIDGRIHAPDFIAHLVGFALKLRNLGVSDHGLIRELSAPLAGSLYTGEGHSRLYDDERVYDLALEFALETTSVGNVPLQVKKYEIPTNANPYILPWIMRGLLEEDFVKTELNKETEELLKQFDEWKPATKVLKDVKYRLEAVRSKL